MKRKRVPAFLLILIMLISCLSGMVHAEDSPLLIDKSALAEPVEFGSYNPVTIKWPGVLVMLCQWMLDGQPIDNALTLYGYDEGASTVICPPTTQAGQHTLECEIQMALSLDEESMEEVFIDPCPTVEPITYTVKEPKAPAEGNDIIETDNYKISLLGNAVSLVKKERADFYNEHYYDCYAVLLDESVDDNADLTLYLTGKEGKDRYDNGFNFPIITSDLDWDMWTEEGAASIDAGLISRSLNYKLSGGNGSVRFLALTSDTGVKEYLKVFFTKDESYFQDDLITSIETTSGQFENRDIFLSPRNKETILVVPYGVTNADVTLTLNDSFDGVRVNGGEKQPVDSEGKVTVTLTAGIPGRSNLIRLTKEDRDTDVIYNLICAAQKYTGMPDKVVDYLCIGSQYTSVGGDMDYGLRPVQSLVGSSYDAGGGRVKGENGYNVGGCGPVSLGGWGGYITYYYENAIYDDPNNPYGIDFITFGNSVEGSNEFGEPGQVWVSEDGENWYALAGGMHYEDYADWDYSVTYVKNQDGLSEQTDKYGESKGVLHNWPEPRLYPYHTFEEGEDQRISLTGINFQSSSNSEFGNALPPFAGFGYTDSGAKGTVLPGEDTSTWAPDEFQDKLARNIAGNPYQGTFIRGTREFSAVTDGMDLAWAVDENGQPVQFPDGIHYIKIVTASNIEAGAIGEKSCEVNMVRVAQPAAEAVGVTAAPAKIVVDGTELALEEGKYVYDAVVDGAFLVDVDAPEGTNVYINNLNNQQHYRLYEALPTHQIVRVIVQEGQKEPVIYTLNLTEQTEGEPEPSATLTLNTSIGSVNGSQSYSVTFDEHMSELALPTPTYTGSRYQFDGWYLGQTRVTTYPSVVKDTAYTARWTDTQAAADTPADNTITVSFRLIGSTLTDADVDLSEGMDGFHGAEYVNWVPTTRYTMPEDATVADLFIRAMNDAGLQYKGAEQGYVSSVWAPEKLGGYELSEFTNGKFSGWMYTMNGKHTNAIREQTMTDGAEIIWHYVNDYRYEVEDWFDEPLWPSLATDDTYYSLWLNAPDTDPNASDAPAGGGSQAGGSDAADGVVPAADVAAAAEADKALAVETENGTVTLPAEAVQALAESGEDVTVTVTENDDGTTTVDVAVGGETADVDVKVALDAPDEGQVLVIVHADGTEEVVKKSVVEDGKVYAEIPAGATVKVVDNKKTFPDVPEDAWYADAVEFAASHELFAGTDKGFEPAAPMTRAMLAAVLYRLEDATATGTNPFADVPDGTWYTDAVIWASAEGIVAGTDKGFEPNANITREQIAAMLYRYAKAIGLDMSASAELSAFPDGGDVASWASEAMRWAVGVGLFHGNADGSLNPKGDATRAEVATLLTAMVKLIVK